MLPFDIADLEEAVENGDVTRRPHPSLPLYIYNYSPECQYRNKWNDVTLNCRGLILDDDFNIVARPWKKFFNLGQVDLPIQLTDPVEVMDKADGSLGILYPLKTAFYSGHHDYAIATRGSFASEQAVHATKVWSEKYDGLHPMDGFTMLFEIVYPGNRIVLNYDGMDDLILLGAVETENGRYISPQAARSMWFKYVDGLLTYTDWTGPVVEVMPFNTISDALGHMDRKNAEGYVIRSHNFMVKVKQPDYLDLHRLVTNMNPKSIWEKLKDGKSVDQICMDLPDEFHQMAKDFADPLMKRYAERSDEILKGYSEAVRKVIAANGAMTTRKDYAKVFTKSRDAKYFFALLDDRSIRELLWGELKPRETVSIRED